MWGLKSCRWLASEPVEGRAGIEFQNSSGECIGPMGEAAMCGKEQT